MTTRSPLGQARRIALAVTAGLAGVAALAPAGATAATPATPAASGSELFVLTGGEGSLVRTGRSGVYRLRFDAPAARVTGFTDRPQRVATSDTLRRFVRGWRASGFAADPPNAALVLDGAPRGRDTFVFELSRPRLARDGALTLTARRLATVPGGGLRELGRGADRVLPPRAFRSASLFVDGGAVPTYVLRLAVTLGVAGDAAVMEFGENWELSPYPGDSVPQFNTSAGVELLLPVNAIVIGGSPSGVSASMSIQVAGGLGPITGVVQLPAGATATATVGNGAPVSLSNGPFSLPVG